MKLKYRILLSIPVTVLVFIVTFYLAFFQFNLIEYIVNRELGNRIGENLPLRVHIGEISGDFISRLLLKDIWIIYEDSQETYTMAHIPELFSEYSVRRFWMGHIEFKKIFIDSAEFTLMQSIDGRWLVPRPLKASEQKREMFDFNVREIGLNNLTYSALIQGLNFRSSDKRFNLLSADGNITLTGNRLMFQDVEIITDSSDVVLGGVFVFDENLQTELQLDAKKLNLNELSQFIKANLDGNVSASGKMNYADGYLEGSIDVSGTCRITGKGGLDFSVKPEKYYLQATVDSFNLDNLVFDSYFSDFNGALNLNGRGLHSNDMVLDIVANLDESWFDEYHAHKIIGDMTITTDSINFRDKFAVKYHNNTFFAAGKLDYRGPIELSGIAIFDDLSVFNGHSLWIYEILSGEAAIDFDIARFLFDREGKVNIHLVNGTAYEVPYDTIFLKMHLDSQYVFIDSSRAVNKQVSMVGYGNLDYLSYPQILILDNVYVDFMGLLLDNDGIVRIDIDSTGYNVINCRLARPVGYIEGKGRINYDESMNFSLLGDRIEIAPWVGLISNEYDIGGLISGEADLGGTFLEPEIKFTGTLDTLTYQNLWLGDLCSCFKYRDKRIIIDSVSLKSEKGYYKASGIYPMDLAFTNVENRFLDEEQDIQLSAYDEQLKLVSRLIYEVEDFTGKFKADMRLTGTPRQPHIDGTAAIREGRLKPYDLEYPLQDMYADIKMVNQTIFLDSVSATCKNGKKTGIVTASGEVVIKSIDVFDYNVDVSARNFPVKYELGDITALAERADFKVQGLTPPIVNGDIKTKSVTYRENFAEENEGWLVLSTLTGENTWDLNINLEALSNIWIKNDDIDAEFAGNINFIRENGEYRYIGSLEILRGKGFLAGRTFRIEPGATINYEDIEYPNPNLDIYATTKIRGVAPDQSGESSTTSDLELRIHVTGTLDEPVIATAEGSQFSTEELLTLLVLEDYEGNADAGSQVGGRMTSALSSLVSSEVGRIGARTLGVETFEIDPVYGDKFDPLGTQLTLGAYALPNLYIYGRSSLSVETGHELGFEYRLKRFLMIEGRADEGDLYQLFLNFYWNY